MLEILKRVYAEGEAAPEDEDDDDDDDDDGEGGNTGGKPDTDGDSLAARIAGLDLDDPVALWQHLTPGERRQFERLMESGKAEALLDPWEPWWTASPAPPVQLTPTLAARADDDVPGRAAVPPVPADLPPLSALLGTRSPAPELPANMVELLCAYVLVQRFFHGQPEPPAAASVVLNVAAVLAPTPETAAAYDSAALAFDYFMTRASAAADGLSRAEGLALLQDVLHILGSTAYVAAALADLHALLKAAHRSKRCLHPAAHLRAAVHKVRFYQAWWHALPPAQADLNRAVLAASLQGVLNHAPGAE